MRCDSCKFWVYAEGVDGADYGVCRRYPPIAVSQAEDWPACYAFPATRNDDWCGEWRKVPAASTGRPATAMALSAEVHALAVEGKTRQQIADHLGIGIASVYRILRSIKTDHCLTHAEEDA